MLSGMSEEYWQRLVKDLKVQIEHLEFEKNMKQQELDKYKNIIDELENRMLLKINRHYNEKQYVVCIVDLEELYDKLKELKGE